MERRKKVHEFISDDELHPVSGGAAPCGENDFGVLLYCSHCGVRTKMQMISLQCAICETCRELTSTSTCL